MDGRKLFAQTVQVRGELVRYDSASHQFTPFLSGISAVGVDFSRDGKWVTYVAFPEGTLWRSKADGSERLQLTFPGLFVLQPRWSPDGTRIAFMAQQPGNPRPHTAEQPWKVYVIPAEGGSLEQPAPGDHRGADPNWSPDGNSLLFGGRPWDETLDLKIVDLRTHAISKVPGSDGLWSPRWSPDGRYILAFPRAGERLPMLFDVKAGQWTELVKMRVGYPEWSRNGDYIYFSGILPGSQPLGLYRLRIRDRKLEQVGSLKGFRWPDSPLVWGWLGLGPDDSPLLLRDAGTHDIFALDWEAP
jgi:Tol biopolymer transport system component